MSSGLNTEQLRQKYLEERDKRLSVKRDYIDPVGLFPDFDRDPWIADKIEREPLTEDVDVLMTGAGLSALVSAAALHDAGIANIRMIDVAGDFGGVWYWNRYPGVRCDIESYVYLPLLEEVGTIPTEKYSTGKEIFEHAQAIGRHYNFYDKALFQTKITEARWDEATSRWHVSTDRGDLIRSRFLIGTSGYLHYPKFPNIPGIRDFKGKLFHPCRWDAKYTGGDSNGNLSGLKDQRVALIGTGATGIQIMPHLAKSAKQAYLFQRTPAAVDARNNRPTDTHWFKNQKQGWHAERMDNFHAVITGMPADVDLVDDCWTHAAGPLFKNAQVIDPENELAASEAMQLRDYQTMQGIRDRVDRVVTDPATAEKLKAWYNLYCKRPLYADDYLESFNSPNVRLIDTDGRGVERITETGLVANGEHFEVDCIIVASGFQIGAYEPATATFPIIGRDGQVLAEKWANGVYSVHGLWANGFPNFQVVGTILQAGVSFNYMWLAKEHALHAAAMISRALTEGMASIEVTKDAEDRWNDEMNRKAQDGTKFAEDCTPGYFNNEGDTSKPVLFANTYGGGAREYFGILQAWRDGGFTADTVITYQK